MSVIIGNMRRGKRPYYLRRHRNPTYTLDLVSIILAGAI